MTHPLTSDPTIRVANLRRCHACAEVLDANPTTCPKCGTKLCPPHEQWSTLLKMWLCWRLARTLFGITRTDQEVWEQILADDWRGIRQGSAHPNPRGPRFTNSTPAAAVYDLAVDEAAQWKAAGYPLTTGRTT